jgi:hypothetical protein
MMDEALLSDAMPAGSEGDYKHVTDVGLGVTDLARCLHRSQCSRDPLCRDQVSRGAEAGAFFVSSGMCWYLWVTGISLPIVLPYSGTVSVETPEISGHGHCTFYSILAVLLFRLHQQTKAKYLDLMPLLVASRTANQPERSRIAG